MILEIQDYHHNLSDSDKEICEFLYKIINENLQESEYKIWHAHPVWFLDGNPIVGYSKQKSGIQLMFWSGIDFDEEKLQPSKSGKFKDASIVYNSVDEINSEELKRWLGKSMEIQWDYKNIVKRKGVLERLK